MPAIQGERGGRKKERGPEVVFSSPRPRLAVGSEECDFSPVKPQRTSTWPQGLRNGGSANGGLVPAAG